MDSNDMRGAHVLTRGDLRLIALSFIAERPRHGYGIIKLVQHKTANWYSPSAGIVYPALTHLQEAGYVTVSVEGSKKFYAITAEGRHYLKVNRDLIDAVLARVTALGERVSRSRRAALDKAVSRRNLPPLVEAVLDHLRKIASRRLEDESEAHLIRIIAGLDAKLQQK